MLKKILLIAAIAVFSNAIQADEAGIIYNAKAPIFRDGAIDRLQADQNGNLRVIPVKSSTVGLGVIAGQNTLVAAGTPQPLSATPKPFASSITIMANSGNAGRIMIGGVGVNNAMGSTGTGFPLPSGQTVIWYGADVSTIYFNGTATGDTISYFGN